MNELSQLPMSKIISSNSKIIESKDATVYRFDIFKGLSDNLGKIQKLKSVGSAYLRDGLKTYNVHLKTFLKDQFYLLPNSKPEDDSDFVILTREPAQKIWKKYFWNSVGEGKILTGTNHGIMKLSWDVLSEDLYLCLHPANISELPNAQSLSDVA